MLTEHRAMSRARCGAGLDEVKREPLVEVRVARPRRTHNIRRQLAVACAGLYEIEGRDLDVRIENGKHLGDLHLEQLAEEGTDVYARKKIARAAGSFGRAGVVAELRMVK